MGRGKLIVLFFIAAHAHASEQQLAQDLSAISIDRQGKIQKQTLSVSQLKEYMSGEKGRSDFSPGEPTFAPRADDRERVQDTHLWPYRTVGELDLGCTGTLIGRRHVLTAGHCIYNAYDNEWNDELTFSPGRYDKTTAPFGEMDWERAYTVQGWTEKGETEFDIGMIVLKEPIGQKTGWLSFGYDTKLKEKDMELLGYPGDKPEGTMWRSKCPMLEVVPWQIHYECITYGGMSGSGMWIQDREGPTVMGVHTNGGSEYNLGTRIISAYFRHLEEWKAANP